MPIMYVESSALVKRYIPEKGSDFMDELFDHRTGSLYLVTSILSALEHKSALTRLAKSGTIGESEMKEALAEFWRDRRLFSTIVPIDNAFLEEAGNHLERYPLRSLDALHLAAILRILDVTRRSGETLVVVGSDRELLDACHQEGITVLNPEEDRAIDRLRELG
mgnify:CR=1 FL=1